jgi:hypothetical protein
MVVFMVETTASKGFERLEPGAQASDELTKATKESDHDNRSR